MHASAVAVQPVHPSCVATPRIMTCIVGCLECLLQKEHLRLLSLKAGGREWNASIVNQYIVIRSDNCAGLLDEAAAGAGQKLECPV